MMSLSFRSDLGPVKSSAKPGPKEDPKIKSVLSVDSGLERLKSGGEKSNAVVLTKHDAQLRATVLNVVHTDHVDRALSGSGKADKLVALIDSAMTALDPQATLESAFARYFDAVPKTVVDRMTKLSNAVDAYTSRTDVADETKAIISDALKTVLSFQMPLRVDGSFFRSAAVVGSSDNLEWLAMRGREPGGGARIEATFSRYINGATGDDASRRIGRLSQAVYDYEQLRETSTEDAQLVSSCLRNVLAHSPVVAQLEATFPQKMTPANEKDYFSGSSVKAITQVSGGLVNPYLFQSDPSGKGEDMVAVVKDANRALTERTNTRGQWMSLTQIVQGRVRIGELSVYDRYQRFEDKDLGISIENQHAQNAYTVLGLQPDVAPSQLTALIQELHDTGYQLPGVPMSVVRNAVYQLQAPEGKSEYDEYLQAKMDPSLAQELRQKVASEDDARVLGTVATGVRMHALLYCIREASGI